MKTIHKTMSPPSTPSRQNQTGEEMQCNLQLMQQNTHWGDSEGIHHIKPHQRD